MSILFSPLYFNVGFVPGAKTLFISTSTLFEIGFNYPMATLET